MEQDPIVLFERAADGAAAMAGKVSDVQRGTPTPCTEWDVAALLEHMVGGTGYLLGALGVDHEPVGIDEVSYRASVARCVEELRRPGALERRCMSPAGFEWSIGEAA